MRRSCDGTEVFVSGSFDEMSRHMDIKLPYPFDRNLLNLLKRENPFEQEYHYIRRGSDFAFFVLYKNRMNILTFGRKSLYFNLKVIGYPCSLSNCGYVTNNERFMLEYIKSIKGAKLVLNAEKPDAIKGMTVGETLPSCVFENRFETAEDYLKALRSPYRRRLNRSLNACRNVEVKQISGSLPDVHRLYFNTYQKSAYKLERLEKGFFEEVDAQTLGFWENGALRGFVLLKKDEKKLIFMLCGMDYSRETADLYYFMLYNIIEYAVKNRCTVIDFGQTSEQTKLKFGARLEPRYFYAHHTNKLLNLLVGLGKGLLEYRYAFPKYHVFKEETR